MSRSAAATSRMRASAPSIAARRARGARRRRGVHRRGSWTTVEPLVATSRMPNYHATPLRAAGARQGPLCRRTGRRRRRAKPLSGRGRARTASRSITSRCRSSSIRNRLRVRTRRCCTTRPAPTCWSSREFKRGDRRCRLRRGAGARRRPLPHAPQDAGRDRAARLRRRIRRRPRGADAALGDAGARHRARRARHGARSSGPQIRVVAPDVGGGFGGKGSLYPEEIFVCAAARRLGRAVKWTGDRLEDLTANSQGFDEIVDAELALDGRRPHHGVARRRHRRCRRLSRSIRGPRRSNRCRW